MRVRVRKSLPNSAELGRMMCWHEKITLRISKRRQKEFTDELQRKMAVHLQQIKGPNMPEEGVSRVTKWSTVGLKLICAMCQYQFSFSSSITLIDRWPLYPFQLIN